VAGGLNTLKPTLRLLSVGLLALMAGCAAGPERSDDAKRNAAKTNTALGQQYMERGQYEVALDKLKRAVAYDNTYAPAHTMLAVLYETLGQRDEAEQEYRKAVRHDPDDGDVNNNYGAFLCATGREKEAEQYFVAAVKDPFYQTPEIALSNAGSCALASGDLDKAESFLRQSLEFDDKLPSALLSMARVSYRSGSYLRARAFLQRYEAVGPMNEESLSLGLRIETQLGDEAAASRYRRELMERYPAAARAGANAGREEQ
jgi:type IV pilus assembly protein PilF